MDVYTAGYQFGLGICVNDGDTGGEGADLTEAHTGQKGWSGWAPYGIVYGKQVRKTPSWPRSWANSSLL